ncbi:hypothetical protein WJX72_008096 [[Myrmecia] bisecta]|uniref:Uncharacterized protein n=1 Tax=[Myrmecia] bisecta TaxID=41462 RepID=A0AAW1QG79_9CHLO
MACTSTLQLICGSNPARLAGLLGKTAVKHLLARLEAGLDASKQSLHARSTNGRDIIMILHTQMLTAPQLAKQVGRIIYVPCLEDYTGALRQRLCWDVVRILATKVCPVLADSVPNYMLLSRVKAAADKLSAEDEGSSFIDLRMAEVWETKKWIVDINAQMERMAIPP